MSNSPSNDRVYAEITAACKKLENGQSRWKALGALNQFRAKCNDISKYAMGWKSKEQLIENEKLLLLGHLEMLVERAERGLDK